MAEQALVDNVLARIQLAHSSMAKGARRIAEFILEDPRRVLTMSVTDLAGAVQASEGSIINFAKRLGLSGYQQLKLSLAREIVEPPQVLPEALDPADDVDVACRKIFHAGIQAMRDTLSLIDPRTLREAVRYLRAAERIEVYGVGAAASIAQDTACRMLCIGLDAKAVIDSHLQAISASLAGPGVAVLTLSHSGAAPETVAATRIAQQAGAKTVVITNYGRSPVQAYADVVLFTMARESLFRGEVMTSRVTQLCLLDALIAALGLADYRRAAATLERAHSTLAGQGGGGRAAISTPTVRSRAP